MLPCPLLIPNIYSDQREKNIIKNSVSIERTESLSLLLLASNLRQRNVSLSKHLSATSVTLNQIKDKQKII